MDSPPLILVTLVIGSALKQPPPDCDDHQTHDDDDDDGDGYGVDGDGDDGDGDDEYQELHSREVVRPSW